MGRKKATAVDNSPVADVDEHKDAAGDAQASIKGEVEDKMPKPETTAVAEPTATPVTTSSGGIRSWLNLSSLGVVLAVCYLYTTMSGMKAIIYPFDGVVYPTGTQLVKPLWPEVR
jgi:hypothetical protein